MTLYTYGGTPADVLTDTAGNVVPNYPMLVKVAGTGATVTALFEADGTTPIGTLRTNASSSSQPGAVRTFKAADVTAIEYEYLDTSGNPVRWYEAARELASAGSDALPTTGGTLTGNLQNEAGAASDTVYGSFVTGDPFDRYRRLASGEEQWGSGSAAREIRFYRSGTGTMTLTGTLSADNVDLSGGRIFNVIGAVGNGSTDDRAVIQSALDAAHTAGGGIVIIPPGKTYGISTFLVVYDNTVIWAYGATLKAIGTGAGLLRNFLGTETFTAYTGHSHIQVLGGTWDGNASDGSTGTVTAETDVLNFVHCSDITVRDATIRNVSSAHALEFNSTDGGRAINCRFEGYRDNSGTSARQFSEAVQIDMAKSGSSSIGSFDNTPAKNIVVQGCYFGPSTRLGVFGRAVGSHTVTAGVTYDNIQVIGNRIDGTLQDGIYAYGWRRSAVADNIITGTGWSGIKGTIPDPATTAISPHSLAITGNVIEGAATDSAIRYVGYAAYRFPGLSVVGNVIKSITGNAIHAEYCAAPSFEGNHVDTTSSTGLYAHYSDSAKITGNTVKSAGSNGINIAGSVGALVSANLVDTTSSNFGIFVGQGADGSTNSTDAMVIGNHVVAASSAGIRCSTNATRCTVASNKIRKGGGSTANGITLAASATGAVIIDNDLTGNAWSATTALSVSTAAPTTGPGAMNALPGSNLVDTDLTALPPLEAALRPSGRYETTSRLRCGTTSTPTSGTLYLVPIWLPAGFLISNLSFVSSTGITSPTHWWFTLHNSSRVALARTADQTTTAWAGNTLKTVAIAQTTAGSASTYTTTYAGLHYLGVMYTGSALTLMSEGSPAQQCDVAPAFGATDTGQTTPPTVTSGAFTATAPTGAAILAYAFAS